MNFEGHRVNVMGSFFESLIADYVPLSAICQNSEIEKYIQTSITDWNLHFPENYVNRRVQEEVLAS